MRHRGQHRGDGGEAAAILGANRMRAPLPHASSSGNVEANTEKVGDVDDTDLGNAVALKLRCDGAAEEELNRRSYWTPRCSMSSLLALLIWLGIALIVYCKIGPAAEGNMGTTGAVMLPEGCRGDNCLQDGGSEPFGVVLGVHDGVFAYSNCYSHTCISYLEHAMAVPLPVDTQTAREALGGTSRVMTTGMKWQCVEYARRYWLLRGRPTPAVFGSVEGAADIWSELQYVTLLDNETTAPLMKYENGATLGYGGSAPRVGDLLIYPRDEDGVFPYGHVAVVVGVEWPPERPRGGTNSAEGPVTTATTFARDSPLPLLQGSVYIAEQNWHSAPWPGPFHNYSRALPILIEKSADGKPVQYTITDPYHAIQGWVRYQA